MRLYESILPFAEITVIKDRKGKGSFEKEDICRQI